MQLEYEIIENLVNNKPRRKLIFQVSDEHSKFKFILIDAHKISRYSLETFLHNLTIHHSCNLNKHQGIFDATIIYDAEAKTIVFKTCTKLTMSDSYLSYRIPASDHNKEVMSEAITRMIEMIDRKC